MMFTQAGFACDSDMPICECLNFQYCAVPSGLGALFEDGYKKGYNSVLQTQGKELQEMKGFSVDPKPILNWVLTGSTCIRQIY